MDTLILVIFYLFTMVSCFYNFRRYHIGLEYLTDMIRNATNRTLTRDEIYKKLKSINKNDIVAFSCVVPIINVVSIFYIEDRIVKLKQKAYKYFKIPYEILRKI